MFGIAGYASRLFDGVIDDGDHDVVGDAALARAVIVESVTWPKPALFHSFPRTLCDGEALIYEAVMQYCEHGV